MSDGVQSESAAITIPQGRLDRQPARRRQGRSQPPEGVDAVDLTGPAPTAFLCNGAGQAALRLRRHGSVGLLADAPLRASKDLAKALEDFGTRVQYSVFGCRLEPVQIRALKKRLYPYVKDPQDSVRFYSISADDVGRIEIIGRGNVTEDQAFYLR